MSKEMVTITKKEYDRLDERDTLLDCYEAAGVDNWNDGGLVNEYMREAGYWLED
mgnify:CR=1 FL=1|tara:strand:- start:41 stop:202 length:162 start_codon:yes stop_codon:yes gene_type:complete